MTRLERRMLDPEWAKRAVAFRNDPDDPRHGSRRGYDYLGCRCGDCRQGNADRAAAHKAVRQGLPPGDPRHGENGYTNYGCKCDEVCRPEHRARTAQDRARRRKQTLPPGDPRHGLNGYQNYGCRCDEVCRPATRAAKAQNRQRKRERTAA